MMIFFEKHGCGDCEHAKRCYINFEPPKKCLKEVHDATKNLVSDLNEESYFTFRKSTEREIIKDRILVFQETIISMILMLYLKMSRGWQKLAIECKRFVFSFHDKDWANILHAFTVLGLAFLLGWLIAFLTLPVLP